MPTTGPDACTLYGCIAEHPDGDIIRFAHDLDPKAWIDIPRRSIESRRTIGRTAEGLERVSLTVKTESSGRALAAVLAVSLEAVMSLGRKVVAVMDGDALQPQASQACTDCIKSCRLQLAEDDDPFKQIVCMLNCKACP